MSRRRARELAFKALFQIDQSNSSSDAAFHYLLEQTHLSEKEAAFAWELITNTLNNLDDIDSKICKYTQENALERMPAVDKAILRLGAYEVAYAPGMEPVIAIDEAIELAKIYGDNSAPGFVNALLDRIKEEHGI